MTKLEELREYLNQEIGNLVTVFYDRATGRYGTDRIRIRYEGCWVCSIYDGKATKYDLFDVVFYDPFTCRSAGCLPSRTDISIAEIPRVIQNRINICELTIMYNGNNKEKEVKNMAKRHFIVEKMEVEHKCCEPDVINMTIRQEPDGIIHFQTARELKTQIESLDTDKRSIFHDDALLSTVYAISARGNGKTKLVLDRMKSGTFIFNGIKDVIFNDPATIVFWIDGSKTVVKCQKGETFDPEKGLAMAISKKVLGNDYGYYETFAKHVGRYHKKHKEK